MDNTAMPSWSRTTIYTTLGEESSGSVGSGMESGESTAGGDGGEFQGATRRVALLMGHRCSRADEGCRYSFRRRRRKDDSE